MDQTQSLLLEASRIGIGIIFLIAVSLDFTCRAMIFDLMVQKRVPKPWLFYIGAILWKTLTSICLILNIYTFWAALLLALYILLAICVFKNFWSAPQEHRNEQLIEFITNLAVSFGLLAVAAGYYV